MEKHPAEPPIPRQIHPIYGLGEQPEGEFNSSPNFPSLYCTTDSLDRVLFVGVGTFSMEIPISFFKHPYSIRLALRSSEFVSGSAILANSIPSIS